MNKICLILICSILFINCSKNAIVSETGHGIYVSGYEFTPVDYPEYGSIPKYWVNGKAVYLPDASYKHAIATGITVIGSDVYVAGDSTSSHIPFYWKNGKPIAVNSGSIVSDIDLKAAIASNSQFWKYSTGLPYTLYGTNHFPHVTVNAVCISGTDIYAVGVVDNITSYRGPVNGTVLAVYWKNGVLIPLEDSTNYLHSSVAYAIKVVGADVYIAGGNCYWKNSQQFPLNGIVWSISGIAVDGNDVYVSGSGPSSLSNISEVKYWKNGNPVELDDQPTFYQTRTTTGISVVSNNVYLSTTANNYLPNASVINIAKYWANNSVYNLSNDKNTWDFTTGIFVK